MQSFKTSTPTAAGAGTAAVAPTLQCGTPRLIVLRRQRDKGGNRAWWRGRYGRHLCVQLIIATVRSSLWHLQLDGWLGIAGKKISITLAEHGVADGVGLE